MSTDTFYQTYHEEQRLSGGDNRHLIELYRKRFLYNYLIERYHPKSILQVACGTGVHTKWLCEKYPDIDIYASDLLEEHVAQVPKDYPNLKDLRAWDCANDSRPASWPEKFDLILVEGAWYHLNQELREKLLENLTATQPDVVVIDYLSALHEVTQHLLRFKKFNDSAVTKHTRPDSCFTFDTKEDLTLLNKFYPLDKISIFPVDLSLRFGYKDFNEVPDTEFFKYLEFLNTHVLLLSVEVLGCTEMTEHGCYVCEN